MKKFSISCLVFYALFEVILLDDVDGLLFPKGSAPQVPFRSYSNRTSLLGKAPSLPIQSVVPENTYYDEDVTPNNKPAQSVAPNLPVYSGPFNSAERYETLDEKRRESSVNQKDFTDSVPSHTYNVVFRAQNENIGTSRSGHYPKSFNSISENARFENFRETIPNIPTAVEPNKPEKLDSRYSGMTLAPETDNDIFDQPERQGGSKESNYVPYFGRGTFNYVPPVFYNTNDSPGTESEGSDDVEEKGPFNEGNRQGYGYDDPTTNKFTHQSTTIRVGVPSKIAEGGLIQNLESNYADQLDDDIQPNENDTAAIQIQSIAESETLELPNPKLNIDNRVTKVVNIDSSAPGGELNSLSSLHQFIIEHSRTEDKTREAINQDIETTTDASTNEERMTGVNSLLEIETSNMQNEEPSKNFAKPIQRSISNGEDESDQTTGHDYLKPSSGDIKEVNLNVHDDTNNDFQSSVDNSDNKNLNTIKSNMNLVTVPPARTNEADSLDAIEAEFQSSTLEPRTSELPYQADTAETVEILTTTLNNDDAEATNSDGNTGDANNALQVHYEHKNVFLKEDSAVESINTGDNSKQTVEKLTSVSMRYVNPESESFGNRPVNSKYGIQPIRNDHPNTGNTLFTRNLPRFNQNYPRNRINEPFEVIPDTGKAFGLEINSDSVINKPVRPYLARFPVYVPTDYNTRNSNPAMHYPPAIPQYPDSIPSQRIVDPNDFLPENYLYPRYREDPELRNEMYIRPDARNSGSHLNPREVKLHSGNRRNNDLYSFTGQEPSSQMYDNSPHYKRSINPYEYLRKPTDLGFGQTLSQVRNTGKYADVQLKRPIRPSWENYPTGKPPSNLRASKFELGKPEHRPNTATDALVENSKIDFNKVMDMFRTKAAVSIPVDVNTDDWNLQSNSNYQTNLHETATASYSSSATSGNEESTSTTVTVSSPEILLSCIRAAKRCKALPDFYNFCFLDCFTKKTGSRMKRSDGTSPVSILNKLIKPIQASMNSLCVPLNTIYTSTKMSAAKPQSFNSEFITGLANNLVPFIIENSNTDFTALRTVTRHMEIASNAHNISRQPLNWKVFNGNPGCRLKDSSTGLIGPTSKLISLFQQNIVLADVLLPGYMVASSAALINSGTGFNLFSYVKEIMDNILGISCGLVYYGQTEEWPACPPENPSPNSAAEPISLRCNPKKIFKYVYVFKNGTRAPNQEQYRYQS